VIVFIGLRQKVTRVVPLVKGDRLKKAKVEPKGSLIPFNGELDRIGMV